MEGYNFREASINAVCVSMTVIRRHLINSQLGEIVTKRDQTLVTIADHESQALAQELLNKRLPDIPFIGEEGGTDKQEGDLIIWYDPLDGTRAFVNAAPTSTVICALYSKVKKSLLEVTIAEPAYGRVWHATQNSCELGVMDPDTQELIHEFKPCRVWSGEMSPQSQVLLDVSSGFFPKDREYLDTEAMIRLMGGLQRVSSVHLYGSNGLNQVLVATGAGRMVSSVTTAMGGPWDAAGALAVIGAGGSCSAYKLRNQTFTEVNPLDPTAYEILLTANNEKNLRTIEGVLFKCFG